MRTFTRKLLSLLLAFTMVCAMVPAALAADDEGQTDPSGSVDVDSSETSKPEDNPGEGGGDQETCNHDNTTYVSNNNGTHNKVCNVCQKTIESNVTCKEDGEWQTNNDSHWKVCTDCQGRVKEGKHSHATGATPSFKTEGCEYTCETCEKTYTVGHDWSNWVDNKDGTHSRHCETCDPNGDKAETENHDFRESYTCADKCGAVNNAYATSVVITDKNVTLDIDKSTTLSAVAYSGKDEITNRPITWESNSRCVTIDSSTGRIVGNYAGTAEITASADYVSDYIYVTVEADADLDVTIYEGMGTYYFSDEDADGVSLEDLLYDALDDAGYDDRYDYFDDLTFTISGGTTSIGTIDDDGLEDLDEFGDVEFTIKKTGTFTATYKIYDGHTVILSGTITIEVEEGGSVGDIIYTAKTGEDVEFDVDDFEDFWDDNSSKGSLDYVMFDSVSNSKGDLVDNEGDDVSTKTKYYVDPGSKQIDLDGITFEPARNLKTAVTIDFTAYGTNKKSVSGTVVILYTEKEPEAIVYSSTGKNITLDRDDFLDNYEDTVGSSASNIQIQFLDAPSNGTLYYNYNEKTEKGTELTSKNVQNYTFSTNTRASRSIEDVTYVPDSRGRTDTIKFAAYTSSGELRYYGEVTFGQTVQNVSVSMTSTSAGVTFQTSSFTGADSAMLTVSSISFGTPSSGTLYKNWTGTSGTRVTASDMFSYVASVTGNPSLSTVTYVPVAGYSGNVTIPFSAYSTTGNSIINGTVTIRVTATTTTTVFTDVPTTGSQAWAAPYISRLYNAGVVSGVTPTTYGPKQAVKWGEALKMVLRAAGYPAQTEGTGSNWAANYLTYAYNNGLVSSNSIDLNSNITRLEMAELAAKALKMSPASRINSGIVGPTDTTNGYVYALYNAGIVGGDSSSGQNRYNGGSSLNRDEMAKIVCGVMDYNG